MQINVLLPSGTRTVDLDELKELVRQGVVQPSTLLETGGQRGKAKNVPALKPIFAELVAAQAEAPEPTTFPTSPTPPEPPVFPSTPTPPEPPVFSPISTPPEPPQFDAPSTFPDFSTFETPQPAPSFDDVYGLEDSAAPNAFATETSLQQENQSNTPKWSWNWRDGLISPNESPVRPPQATPSTDNSATQVQSPELKQTLKDIKIYEKKTRKLEGRQYIARVVFLVAKIIVFVYMFSVFVDPFFTRFDVAGDRNESYYGASISIIEATLIGLYDFSYFNLVFCVVALTTLYGLQVIVDSALDRNILEFQREKERLTTRRQSLENLVDGETPASNE